MQLRLQQKSQTNQLQFQGKQITINNDYIDFAFSNLSQHIFKDNLTVVMSLYIMRE